MLKKFEASAHDIKQKQIYSLLTNNQKQLNKLKVAQNTTPQNTTEHVQQHREKLKSPRGPWLKHETWGKREGSRQDQQTRRDLGTFWHDPEKALPANRQTSKTGITVNDQGIFMGFKFGFTSYG